MREVDFVLLVLFSYRAWDLLYNMLSWPEVTDENVAEFVGFYVDERKIQGDKAITTEKIFAEIEVHTPYVLLEHMVFAVTFDFASEEYMEILRNEYQIEAKKLGRTVVYSDSVPLTVSLLAFISLFV